MSNSQWFYSDAQQQQLGPVNFEQIQQLAASGQIQPATLIWSEGMPNWTAASQVQGVIDQAPQSATPPVVEQTKPPSQSNPYATPSANTAAGVSSEGSYPIPFVKKSSFALFLILNISGLLLFAGGLGILVMKSVELASDLAKERSMQIETKEDAAEWEAQQQAELEKRAEEMFTEDVPISVIACFFGGLVLLLISKILGLVTLYRAWCVVQPGGARSTPGKAVGFLFIPLFGIYWAFVAYHGWSKDWNRIQSSHANLAQMPRVAPGLFLTTLILAVSMILAIFIPLINLLFLVGVPIMFIVMFFQIYRVVNSMAAASSQSHQDQSLSFRA